jgi:hypothetical protein
MKMETFMAYQEEQECKNGIWDNNLKKKLYLTVSSVKS